MALPTDVKLFLEPLDPYDILDFSVDVSPLLEVGESIASYTVNLPTESVLLGLQINTTAPYATSITGNVITFWLSVSPTHQNDAGFAGVGVQIPIQITVITNSVPARQKKRTVAVTVAAR